MSIPDIGLSSRRSWISEQVQVLISAGSLPPLSASFIMICAQAAVEIESLHQIDVGNGAGNGRLD
jgi:hypothetical protein